MYKTEEAVLLRTHAFVDFIERNLSFAASGMWTIFSFQGTIKILLKKQRVYMKLLFLW